MHLLLHYVRFPLILIFKLCKSSNINIFSWDDVAYGIYETDGHVSNASEYGHDVYAN